MLSLSEPLVELALSRVVVRDKVERLSRSTASDGVGVDFAQSLAEIASAAVGSFRSRETPIIASEP